MDDSGKFYMRKCVQNEDGSWTVGEEYDIVSQFPGLRYKSCTGLNDYGEAKDIYTESFPEQDGANVYIGTGGAREQTEIDLTLYFFNASDYYSAADTAIQAAFGEYHVFVEYLLGGAVLFTDKKRGRKVLMYLSEAVEPDTESLKGAAYLSCPFKFTNKKGRSYSLDDTTLETELGITT